MFKSVLVPLDGSPLSERAVPYALALAEASRGNVTLMRAAVAHTLPGIDPTDAQVRVVAEAQEYLETVASAFERRGVPVETAVPYAEPVGGILDEIDFRRADVIVMATHGRSGLGRWVYGSVAEGVLHASSVPVLLVRAWQKPRNADAILATPRVVVPLDGSPFAEAALPVAAEIVRQAGGSLVLGQVITVPDDGLAAEGMRLSYDLEQWQKDARDYLTGVAERVADEYGIARPSTVTVLGDPGERLTEMISEADGTLTVMATHGRTGLGRLLLGSVAASVLRQSSTPLLLVRPGGPPPTSLGAETETRASVGDGSPAL